MNRIGLVLPAALAAGAQRAEPCPTRGKPRGRDERPFRSRCVRGFGLRRVAVALRAVVAGATRVGIPAAAAAAFLAAAVASPGGRFLLRDVDGDRPAVHLELLALGHSRGRVLGQRELHEPEPLAPPARAFLGHDEALLHRADLAERSLQPGIRARVRQVPHEHCRRTSHRDERTRRRSACRRRLTRRPSAVRSRQALAPTVEKKSPVAEDRFPATLGLVEHIPAPGRFSTTASRYASYDSRYAISRHSAHTPPHRPRLTPATRWSSC